MTWISFKKDINIYKGKGITSSNSHLLPIKYMKDNWAKLWHIWILDEKYLQECYAILSKRIINWIFQILLMLPFIDKDKLDIYVTQVDQVTHWLGNLKLYWNKFILKCWKWNTVLFSLVSFSKEVKEVVMKFTEVGTKLFINTLNNNEFFTVQNIIFALWFQTEHRKILMQHLQTVSLIIILAPTCWKFGSYF